MTITMTTFDLRGDPRAETRGRIARKAVLSDLAAATAAGWREWLRRSADRRALRGLSRLDDRLLRDMGLDPRDVRGISGEPLPFGLRVLMSRGRG